MSCPPKERKVTFCDRSFSAESIYKETTVQNGDSQVTTAIDTGQRLGCLHRSDRCLSICSDSSSVKEVYSFRFDNQVFQFTTLPFGMSLNPWILTKLMDVIAAQLRQRAISLFPYQDDWLIRELIRGRLISHTIYCLQTVQGFGFIPNLKKSDLKPALQFTFIGMEFLTQQNIVRVPPDRI